VAGFVVGLEAVAGGREVAGVVTGVAGEARLAVLFTGQGAQRVGMGAGLYRAFPVFAEAFDTVCAALDPLLDVPVREVVFTEAGTPRAALLDQTLYTQAALFTIETALFRLVHSWGVRPELLIGHSIGEVTAAHVAGVFDLADACVLVAARGRLMQALPAGGAMLAVTAAEADVAAELAGLAGVAGRVEVAAVNSPTSVVVSGDLDAIETVTDRWRRQGWRVKPLTVSHAFHSARMEPMLDQFATTIAGVTFHPPAIPILSNLTGHPANPAEITTTDYWTRHIRHTVRFAQAITTAHHHGITTYLELGPHPTLTPHTTTHPTPNSDGGGDHDGGGDGGEHDDRPVTAVAALRQGRDDVDTLLAAMAHLHVHGVAITWTTITGHPTTHLDLPTYPFQHQHFWLHPTPPPTHATTDPTTDPAEDRFWHAVDHLDTTTVAATLGLPTNGSHPTTGGGTGAGEAGEGGTVEGEVVEGGPGDGLGWVAALSVWRRSQRLARLVRGWCYQTHWTPTPTPTPPTTAVAGDGGRWLLLTPHPTDRTDGADRTGGVGGVDGGWVDVVADGLTGCGLPVWRLVLPADPHQMDQALSQVAAELEDGPGPVAGVVVLTGGGSDSGGGVDGVGLAGAVARLVGVVRAVSRWGGAGRVWCVTRGAVSVGGWDPVGDVGAGVVWGLGRVAGLEQGRVWGGLVDLPAVVDPSVAARLAAVLTTTGGGGVELAVRAGGMFTRRLRRPQPQPQTVPGPVSGSGLAAGLVGVTVLVTGGTGALGIRLARWAADRGAARVVLASRSGEPPADLVAELTERGVAVLTVGCDMADRDAVAGLLESVTRSGPRVGVVVHAAGIADHTPLVDLDPDRIGRVLAGKATGARHLYDLAAEAGVGLLVLFSSIAATWGAAGAGAYAAANAYLDSLATSHPPTDHPPTDRGLRVVSIGWGPWAGTGMAADPATAHQLTRRGITPLDPQAALAALDLVITNPHLGPHLTIADIDWSRLAPALATTGPTPLLADLTRDDHTPPTAVSNGDGPQSALTRQLATTTAAQRHRLLLDLIRTHTAQVLGHPDTNPITPTTPFTDLGFDSLMAVELRDRLVKATGLPLPSTLVFDYPTAARLVQHLTTRLTPTDNSEETRIREALATVPLDSLRDAGVLDVLLRLAATGVEAADSESEPQVDVDSIDAMDVDDLIKIALNKSDS
jgi:candicidin polyketide synthase FscE